MKKHLTKSIAVVLGVACLAAFVANARTLSEQPDNWGTGTPASGWAKKYQDQSNYPTQDKRHGTIVRTYRFADDGGAISNINIGEALPDNVIVMGGFIQVDSAMLPATTTNAISITASQDLLATGVTLNSTGLKDIVPQDYDVNNAIEVTNSTTYVTLNITDVAATSGVFTVYLDVWKIN